MVLSDVDIRRYIEQGRIRITPEPEPDQFGSCSVDFRLGSEFSLFEHSRYPYIDLNEIVDIPSRDFQDLTHLIAPGRVVWQRALAKELAPLLSAGDSGGGGG